MKSELEEILNKNKQLVEELKQENTAILAEIKRTGFGKNDSQMSDFLKAKTFMIENYTAPQDFKTFATELKKIAEDLQAVISVKEVTEELERKKGDRAKNKIDKIIQVICDIPVEQRGQVRDSNSDLGGKVHLAIASHRHLSFFRPIKFDHNEINEKKASRSFKEFKAKLNEHREVESDQEVSIEPKVS